MKVKYLNEIYDLEEKDDTYLLTINGEKPIVLKSSDFKIEDKNNELELFSIKDLKEHDPITINDLDEDIPDNHHLHNELLGTDGQPVEEDTLKQNEPHFGIDLSIDSTKERHDKDNNILKNSLAILSEKIKKIFDT